MHPQRNAIKVQAISVCETTQIKFINQLTDPQISILWTWDDKNRVHVNKLMISDWVNGIGGGAVSLVRASILSRPGLFGVCSLPTWWYVAAKQKELA